MPDVPTQRPARLLAALALAAILAVFALYALMIQTEGGQDLDASAFSGPLLEPSLGGALANTLLQTFTVGSMVLAMATIAAIGYLRGGSRLALVAVAVIAGSLITTELLKHVVFDRPDLLAIGDTKNTFPSGHTTIATSLGVAAMLVVPPAIRPAAVVGAIALASVIGVATLAGGWHRPSDVLGAYLVTVGVAALVAAASWDTLAAPRDDGDEGAERFGTLGAVALGAVLGLLAAFAIGIADNASDVDWAAIDRGLLVSAIALPAAATALILGFAAIVFRPWSPPGARLKPTP